MCALVWHEHLCMHSHLFRTFTNGGQLQWAILFSFLNYYLGLYWGKPETLSLSLDLSSQLLLSCVASLIVCAILIIPPFFHYVNFAMKRGTPVFRVEWVLLLQTGSLLSGGRSGHSSQLGKPNSGLYSSQQASLSPGIMGWAAIAVSGSISSQGIGLVVTHCKRM